MSTSDDGFLPPPPAAPAPPGGAFPPPPPAAMLPPQPAPPGAWSGAPAAAAAPGPVPPASPKKSKTPLLIGAGLLAVAALVGGILAFAGGDDDGSTSRPDRTEDTEDTDPDDTRPDDTEPAPTDAPASSAPVTTATPLTLPATVVPTTVAPATTVAPSGEVVEVVDDTGSFSVLLPAEFEVSTTPVPIGAATMAHVTGAADLDRYLTGDFSVMGITVLAGPTDAVGTPADLLAVFDPGDECTSSTTEVGAPTSKGAATIIRYDGCGGADYSEVLIALNLEALGRILFVGVQSVGPSGEAPRQLAMAVLDSVARI